MFETGGAIPAEALFLEYREASGEILPPRYFRGPMVPRGCVRSRPPGRCRLILPTLQLMRGRTRGSKRCVGTSRRRSPRRRSRRGRRVSGRSPKTAFPSSAPCGVFTVPDPATGHSVWGMLNAPATGEAMSELILDGVARHVDLTPFAPGRLPPFDPARLRDLAEARVLPNRAPSGI